MSWLKRLNPFRRIKKDARRVRKFAERASQRPEGMVAATAVAFIPYVGPVLSVGWIAYGLRNADQAARKAEKEAAAAAKKAAAEAEAFFRPVAGVAAVTAGAVIVRAFGADGDDA